MNRSISKRWGWKLLFIFVCAVFMFGTIYTSISFQQDLNAASMTAPTFQMYDKVKLANKEFTVIGTGDNVQFLSDTDTGSEVTWNQATSELTSFSTGLGTIGSSYFNNKLSMPLSTELSITDNQLPSSIPNIAKDWWLGDSTSNNRNKFIDKNNRTDGEVEFNTTIITDAKECGIQEGTEVGVKVNNAIIDTTISELTGKSTGYITIQNTATSAIYYTAYTDNACKNNIPSSPGGKTPSSISFGVNYESVGVPIENGLINPEKYTESKGLYRVAILYGLYGKDFMTAPLKTYQTVYGTNECINLQNLVVGGKLPLTGIAPISDAVAGSIKIRHENYIGKPIKFQIKEKNLEAGKIECSGQTHPAGTSYVRPKVNVSTSDIIWGGNAKRTYAVGSQIKDSFPTSEGNTYLTLRSDAMSAGLTSGSEGVEGTTLTVKRPQDGKVKLPITITGKQEGTQYLGASMNVGGSEKYNILKQVNIGDHEVPLDITNISNYDKLSELKLTLFVEDEGSYDTSYMSNGTEITIVFEEDVVDEIPEGWVIVSPNANANGWNKEAVSISLSEEAKDAGYTLEVVNDVNVVQKSGNVITYENETSGITPRIRLKKGDAVTNAMQVREIKIDTTNPSATVDIENESEWAVKKQLTIHASDAGSGLDKIVVKDPDGIEHTITLTEDSYTYDATKEGTYTIIVSDKAGNATTLTKQISKIDTTAISLTAEKEHLSEDQPKQKITLTYQAGASGISSFKVFYKQGNGEYTYLENITVSDSPMDWHAEMNGWFKFELINKAGEKAEAEVEITQVNPPKPVTKIHAVYQDDASINYKSDTWTKHNIVITLSNANAEVSDPVIFEYSTNGTDWSVVTDDTLAIETEVDTTKEVSLLFRSKVSEAIQEESNKSFIVKIDKTKPAAPIVLEKEKYTQDIWYQDGVTVETQITPKANNLAQEVFVCIGTKQECSSENASWTKTVDAKKELTANGSYELYFKSIDEAGNESELSEAVFVNINNEKPVITIKLKQNPIKELISDLTFGFFYKDSVDIDIVVDFPQGQNGKVYYFIDKVGNGKPADDSSDWIEGTHSSLDPQAKAMIYAKAISDAGVKQYEDSIFQVYADRIPPVITTPEDMENWINDTSVEIAIEDALSGVDSATTRVQIESDPEQSFTLNKGKAKLTNLKNGEYSILVKASDYSKNEASTSFKVKIDTELPQIGEPSADSDGWAEEKKITFTASDAFSQVSSVVVKDSAGSELEVTKEAEGTYQFTVTKNGAYTITVTDHAGNVREHTYIAENIKGDAVEELTVIATNKGNQIASGTWVNGEILFTISGGLDVDTLEKYQVAVTDGEIPIEDVWEDINQSDTHQHKVTGNVNGKTYWFRVVPTNLGVEISKPFVVNLDNEVPYDVTIHTEKINHDPIARFINVMSLGNWLKEEQSVHVEAEDNFTPVEAIRYEYAEENAEGVLGQWQAYPSSLTYEDTDITLYVRAIDLAGNISKPDRKSLRIDTIPPIIEGVKDKDVYKKYYYVYRTITYHDGENGSGIDEDSAIIKKDGVVDTLLQGYKVKDFGSYEVSVKDIAGNEAIVHFQLVPLPDIDTEIDGSDESRDIIDQVQKELEEERENLSPDEIKDFEKWIEDATEKWEKERKKKLEDKETGTIVEGEGDTSFDPNTELIVDKIDETKIPELPRKAIYVYDVYMKKGDTVIQPDGSVKVYLPYNEEEEPIIYEIDEDGNVKEIKGTKENGYVSFITDTLEKYAISNTAQKETKKDVCVVGPDKNLDTKDDVCGSDNSTKNPDGSVDVPAGGKVIFPDKEINAPDGAHINPDGSVDFPDGSHYDPDGNLKPKDEEKNTCTAGPDGKLGTKDDVCGEGNGKDDPTKNEDGSVDVPNGGTIHFPDKEIDAPDGAHINPDGSVELPDGTKYDKDGNEIKKEDPEKKECPLNGKSINLDTDGDGLPDLNLDVYGEAGVHSKPDCKADLNIDINNDKIPDLNIDTVGDGKPNINIDTDGDGYADLNILRKLKKWTPNLNTNVNGFTYDTMVGLTPDLNIDEDGDGKPDRNVDTDGDGLPDVNVDADWFTKRGIKNPSSSGIDGTGNAMGGAKTGDSTKWVLWWIVLCMTCTTMLVSHLYNRRKKYKER